MVIQKTDYAIVVDALERVEKINAELMKMISNLAS